VIRGGHSPRWAAEPEKIKKNIEKGEFRMMKVDNLSGDNRCSI
jgi:hypothetical protein